MESNPTVVAQPTVPAEAPTEYISKNTLIALLIIVLVLSFLGINLLYTTGNIMENITRIFGPIVSHILSIFGYSVGSFIDTSSDAVANVSIAGIDIAHDTAHDVGDLMKKMSEENVNLDIKQQIDSVNPKSTETDTDTKNKISELEAKVNNLQTKNHLDSFINYSPFSSHKEPQADSSASPIQTPDKNSKWCFIGEYETRRGCIDVRDETKCISGQIFPNQTTCMNPLVNTPAFLGTTSERGYY